MEKREDIYNIKYSSLRFVIRLTDKGNLPQDKESAIRGAFGNVLIDRYCDSDKNCEVCDHELDCIAQNILYSPYKIKPDFVTTRTSQSIGYVIECENKITTFKKEDKLQFRIILFGQCIEYAGVLISAVRKAGDIGLGKERLKYVLEYVYDRHDKPVYKDGVFKKEELTPELLSDYVAERRKMIGHPERFEVSFISPVTIKYQKKWIQSLTAEALLDSMARRIYMLNSYVGNEIEQPYILVEEEPCQGYETSWLSSTWRYSERKKEKMFLKGLLGQIELVHVNERLLDMIIACELTHIGKNTSFGFGKYELS